MEITWFTLAIIYWILSSIIYGKIAIETNRSKWYWMWIPVIRTLALMEVAGMGILWMISLLIPVFNIIPHFLTWYNISKLYNKSEIMSFVFGIMGLFLLSIIPGVYLAYFCDVPRVYISRVSESKSKPLESKDWMTPEQRTEFTQLYNKKV